MDADSKLGFGLLLNRPYSPKLNGIELFLPIAKSKFKKAALAIFTGNSLKTNIRKIFAPIIRAVPADTITRCFNQAISIINYAKL